MKKHRPALLPLMLTAAAAAVAFCLYIVFLPATLRNTEAVGFFAWQPDFLNDTLQKPAGTSLLLTAWLEQFFARSWAGAAVLVTLQLLCACATYSLLSSKRSPREAGFYTLFIYMYLAVFGGLSVHPLLSAAFVQTVLVVFLHLNRPRMRRLCLLMLSAGYTLLPFPFLLLLGTALTAVEFFHFRCRANTLTVILLTVLLAVVPPIWSAQVTFVPAARYYAGASTYGAPALLYALGISVGVLLFPARERKLGRTVAFGWFGSICLAGIAVGIHFGRPFEQLQTEERFYALEQAADDADWQQVLRLATEDNGLADPFHLRYALLAESAQGTLPDHLFQYPITAPEQFMFRNVFTLPTCHFNYLFYKNLGYPDEAFHQAFENGTLSSAGYSLRSLRHLTDATLDAGDTALAPKYMAVLEQTSAHDEWLAKRRIRLQALQQQPAAQNAPLVRSRNFVGSIRLDAEWVYALEQDSTNTKLLDYLLCSFLLKKQPEKFARLMTLNPQYAGRPLPAPYAEALALFANEQLQWDKRFLLSPATVQEWRHCLQLQQEGRMDELARRCAGTYWYYLFFAALPTETLQPQSTIY